MKKIKYIISTILITTICCVNIIPINAYASSKDDMSSLEEAKHFLLSTGMTKNQLSEMNDLLKLEIYNSFKESNTLDDDIEFKKTATKIISIGDKNEDGPTKRNIPESRLKITSSSFNNHQMGRVEVFGMFEWLHMPFEQLLNNDSFAYTIDEGWDILPKSEALTLYLANGEVYHKFTRPSSGNKYGSAYRIATSNGKEFRQIKCGIAHFSLRKYCSS